MDGAMLGSDWKNHRMQGTVRVLRADFQPKKVYAMPMAMVFHFPSETASVTSSFNCLCCHLPLLLVLVTV